MKRMMNTLLLGCVFLMMSGSVRAESPREQLNQMVQQLQQNSNDNNLREKIIKLVQELKPLPAIPEEARRSFIEGGTIVRNAKDRSQQMVAVNSFKKALDLAPWWADAYYNLALAQELAGQLGYAQQSLQLYMKASTDEKEKRNAQDRIYELDAKLKLNVDPVIELLHDLLQNGLPRATQCDDTFVVTKETALSQSRGSRRCGPLLALLLIVKDTIRNEGKFQFVAQPAYSNRADKIGPNSLITGYIRGPSLKDIDFTCTPIPPPSKFSDSYYYVSPVESSAWSEVQSDGVILVTCESEAAAANKPATYWVIGSRTH